MKTVIEMAREAGIGDPESDWMYWKAMERFADLVRADEREACVEAADDQWVRNPNVSGGDAIRARSNT